MCQARRYARPTTTTHIDESKGKVDTSDTHSLRETRTVKAKLREEFHQLNQIN